MAAVQGGWWQLFDVRRQSEQEFETWLELEPISCPRCGEPLTPSPTTDGGATVDRFCRFDGFRFPRDWVPPVRT